MAKSRSKLAGPKLLKAWREAHETTLETVGRAIGFRDGSYVQKYEQYDGTPKKGRLMPLDRAIKLSRYTGIPLEKLVPASQLRTVRKAQELLGYPGGCCNGSASNPEPAGDTPA